MAAKVLVSIDVGGGIPELCPHKEGINLTIKDTQTHKLASLQREMCFTGDVFEVL